MDQPVDATAYKYFQAARANVAAKQSAQAEETYSAFYDISKAPTSWTGETMLTSSKLNACLVIATLYCNDHSILSSSDRLYKCHSHISREMNLVQPVSRYQDLMPSKLPD